MSTELDQSIAATISNLRASEVYLRTRMKEITDAFNSFDKQLDDLEALVRAQTEDRLMELHSISCASLKLSERA